jgi:hypothetical protein
MIGSLRGPARFGLDAAHPAGQPIAVMPAESPAISGDDHAFAGENAPAFRCCAALVVGVLAHA